MAPPSKRTGPSGRSCCPTQHTRPRGLLPARTDRQGGAFPGQARPRHAPAQPRQGLPAKGCRSVDTWPSSHPRPIPTLGTQTAGGPAMWNEAPPPPRLALPHELRTDANTWERARATCREGATARHPLCDRVPSRHCTSALTRGEGKKAEVQPSFPACPDPAGQNSKYVGPAGVKQGGGPSWDRPHPSLHGWGPARRGGSRHPRRTARPRLDRGCPGRARME